MVDVPGIVQLLFQPSKLYKQFIDRVVDIPGFSWPVVQGEVIDVRRVVFGTVLAQYLARQRIHVLPVSVAFWRYFLREGGLGS